MSSIYGSANSMFKSITKFNAKHHLPIYKNDKLKIAMVTHNCSGIAPDQDVLVNYLEKNEIRESDCIVVCLQEIVEMKGKNLTKIIYNDNERNLNVWNNYLSHHLDEHVVIM